LDRSLCRNSSERRKRIGAENVKIWDRHSKETFSTQCNADLTLEDWAHGADFFGIDGIIKQVLRPVNLPLKMIYQCKKCYKMPV
jgi:hypothetical protein